MPTDWDLWALFTSAFTSATIAPGSSEAVLVAIAMQGQRSDLMLLGVATFGNSLGALSTWWLGHLAVRSRQGSKRVEQIFGTRAWRLVQRWGPCALLLSWLPVIGDALCFAGGWFRLPLLPSVVALVTGKLGRYATILYLLHTVA